MSIINKDAGDGEARIRTAGTDRSCRRQVNDLHPEHAGSRRQFRTEDRDRRDVEFRRWHGCPRKRAELSLAVGEVHQSASKGPQKHRAGWSFRNETFHGHRDRGRCISEKSKPELCRIAIT